MFGSWMLLFAAGAVEIVMALALERAAGWTRFWPSAIGIVAALASIYLLTHALRGLPVATAYAVWTGIGAVGVTLIGILWLGESAHPLRLVCIGAITAGIVGLRLLEV